MIALLYVGKLWLFGDEFSGDVHVLVLLGGVDDQMPEVVGDGFLVADGADDAILRLEGTR